MNYNAEEFTLNENIKTLSKIKELINELIVLESNLDDCHLHYEGLYFKVLMNNIELSYTTYKNNKDFDFYLSNITTEELHKIIKEVI